MGVVPIRRQMFLSYLLRRFTKDGAIKAMVRSCRLHIHEWD
jgi:hypothetical protein